MKIFKLQIGRNASGKLHMRVIHNKDSEQCELPDLPKWMCDVQEGNLDWFHWGRNAFDAVFGSKDSSLRSFWEGKVRERIEHFDPFLLQVENTVWGDYLPFTVHWEAMVGTTLPCQDTSTTYYPLGRFPSPVDVIRTPKLPLERDECHQPFNTKSLLDKWKVAIIHVPSITPVSMEVNFLRKYLDYLKQKSQNFDLVGVFEFNGHNGREISERLRLQNVTLVDIIAHAADENHPNMLAVNNQSYPWEALLAHLSTIRSVQIILLSCCFSDHFIDKNVPPAVFLCKNGVPAIIAWNPRPYDTTLPHFHRAFYRAMAEGNHIVRAVSTGRSTIFNSIDLRIPRHWIRAFAPRLYLHCDAQIEKLSFPLPSSLLKGI